VGVRERAHRLGVDEGCTYAARDRGRANGRPSGTGSRRCTVQQIPLAETPCAVVCHHVEASAAARAVNDQKRTSKKPLHWIGDFGAGTQQHRPQYSQNKGGLGPNGARHEWGCCAPKHVNLVQQKVDVEPPADNAGKPPVESEAGISKWHQSAYNGDRVSGWWWCA